MEWSYANEVQSSRRSHRSFEESAKREPKPKNRTHVNYVITCFARSKFDHLPQHLNAILHVVRNDDQRAFAETDHLTPTTQTAEWVCRRSSCPPFSPASYSTSCRVQTRTTARCAWLRFSATSWRFGWWGRYPEFSVSTAPSKGRDVEGIRESAG